MKRLIALGLLFIATLTLSACNLIPSDIEVCDPGFELQGTECVEIDPDPTTCDVGYHLDGEDCVIDETSCNEGFHLDGGACVADETSCTTGFHLVEGTCVADETSCSTGFHLEDGACVIDETSCTTGFHLEEGTCVADETECNTGWHLENGVCVIDTNTGTVDYIIDNFDGNLTFLSTMIQNADFTTGHTMSFDIAIEVTEDIDETHYIDGVVTETVVLATTGNIVKRNIVLDVDGEISIDFTMILEEVETGVNVYIDPTAIIDAVTMGDPERIAVLNWVGFENQWVKFEFDDSLENIIQVDVLKEMMVSMFFSEMGQNFFYQVQTDLELDLGIDLASYGLDLGQFVDYLIEEDFVNAQAELDAIDTAGIALHIDLMYLAPELYQVLSYESAELALAGFDITLLDLLNTAHYDSLTDQMVLDVPIDNTNGTLAFFNAFTETDRDVFVEEFIKPNIEDMLFYSLEDDIYGWEIQDELAEFIYMRRYELEGQFGIENIDVLVNELYSEGLKVFWETLPWEQRNYFWTMAQMEQDAGYGDWIYEMIYDIDDYVYYAEEEFINGLYDVYDMLVGAGYDPDAMALAIETNGLVAWYETLDPSYIEPFMDMYVYPYLEGAEGMYGMFAGIDVAMQGDEFPEWITERIFTNEFVISQILPGRGYDELILASNMMLIDFDTLLVGLENVDLQELAWAIMDGSVTYQAYLDMLALTDPAPDNFILFLELWTPAVLELESFMMYTDDIQYLFEGLSQFDDYMTMAYYLDNMMTVTPTKTADDTLLLTTEMDGIEFAQLFDDLQADINLYLQGFETLPFPYDSDWVCIPDGEDQDCDDLNMSEAMAYLVTLDGIIVNVEMDPADPDWLVVTLDLTGLANSLAERNHQNYVDNYDGYWDEYNDVWVDDTYTYSEYNDHLTGFNQLLIEFRMETTASITLPLAEDTDNLNLIAEEFGQFIVAMEGYGFLKEVAGMYGMNNDGTYDPDIINMLAGLMGTPLYLDEIPDYRINQAFDDSMSYVEVTYEYLPLTTTINPLTIDFELVLYWVDGTPVFTDSLGFQELLPLFLDGELVSQAAYDTIKGQVDDATYSLTKVWLLLAFQDNNNDDEYNDEYNEEPY